MSKITICGSGAFGCALGQVLTDNNHEVTLYGVVKAEVNEINQHHQNSRCLASVKLNSKIKATTDLRLALKDCDTLVFAIPMNALDEVIKAVNSFLDHPVRILNVIKGLGTEGFEPAYKIIADQINPTYNLGVASLFGPTFAIELASREKTAAIVASTNTNLNKFFLGLLTTDYFALSWSDDEYGLNVYAALKNISAIISGIVTTLYPAKNTQAAFLASALNEVYQVAKKLGAHNETFFTVGGIGDWLLTNTSDKSRNYQLGQTLAQAKNAEAALSTWTSTTEGATACKVIYNLNETWKLSLPLFTILYRILYENLSPKIVFDALWKEQKLFLPLSS